MINLRVYQIILMGLLSRVDLSTNLREVLLRHYAKQVVKHSKYRHRCRCRCKSATNRWLNESLLTNPPIDSDLCIDVPISRLLALFKRLYLN